MSRRWIVVISLVAAGALVATLAAGLISSSSSGSSTPASTPAATDAIPTVGPTLQELQALAADLSSGVDARILAALADIPPGARASALKSLGSLKAVSFDAGTLRFDGPTGAAVVDAELTDTSGKVRREREVLVKRGDRWLLYSSLVPATATGSPVG